MFIKKNSFVINAKNQRGNAISKVMVWLAWFGAIGLLAFAFNDMLEKQYNPNQAPESVTLGNTVDVTLKQNRYGHYLTQGTINDTPVTFLLDTGATQVSIPARVAERIGLPRLSSSYVNTANGRAEVYNTQIQYLSIGDIFLYNVRAHINPNIDSEEILLGMSALKKVEFTQKGKTLTLRQYRQ